MDLFKLEIEERNLHPDVKNIIDQACYAQARDNINEWSAGLSQRRKEWKKFVKEFQLSFNSSFWELYLNKAFADLGFKVDYSKESPDFCLIHSSGRILNIEAVTSNHRSNGSIEYHSAKGRAAESKLDDERFYDLSAIKLVGKIRDKRELFLAGKKKHPYSSLDHVKGNPFVLAIAPFDTHLSFSQNNIAINRALYGVDSKTGSGRPVIHRALNENSKPVEFGIFTNDSYKEISAIIFSTVGMFSKALIGTNVDGFVKSTRYREMGVVEFMVKEGLDRIGKHHFEIESGHDIFCHRYFNGHLVCGSDVTLCKPSNYRETHLDGLHLYYNPFAETPLPKDLFLAKEITQNDFDPLSMSMTSKHNDKSLVSRQFITSIDTNTV
ncbi:hypothetical protein [Pseudomonas kitaguniensis]|uniref:hypothetical protein n=1 Tax=Pseudomonas kitaguniensis TaxID=2607908 RepID=UPI003BA233AC